MTTGFLSDALVKASSIGTGRLWTRLGAVQRRRHRARSTAESCDARCREEGARLANRPRRSTQDVGHLQLQGSHRRHRQHRLRRRRQHQLRASRTPLQVRMRCLADLALRQCSLNMLLCPVGCSERAGSCTFLVPRIWEGEGSWRSEIMNASTNDYWVRNRIGRRSHRIARFLGFGGQTFEPRKLPRVPMSITC